MSSSAVIADTRVQRLNDRPSRKGEFVLYWMQQSQRAEGNHALEYAVQRANGLALPLVVGFGLTADYPDANARHYRFLLEGLKETGDALARRGIPLVVRLGSPPDVALGLARRAALVVCDRGYLRHQREWRAAVAAGARCPVAQVEADAVVPVDVTSPKAEYAARTIRPKLARAMEEYLTDLRTTPLDRRGEPLRVNGESLDEPDDLLVALGVDRSVPEVSHCFRGGTRRARAALDAFLERRLPRYTGNRNQPQTDDVSYMGMYLHFGHISPVYVALRARESAAGRDERAAFLEELVVRRELAINFVERTPRYDDYGALPEWARKTLAAHAGDHREVVYSPDELERAGTHDPYWNAAMREMRYTGYMHNYMRMYWGKKVLEWSASPQEAYDTVLRLNNKYFLDGRDPNSYANVGWIFGLHDRPWGERPIFGTVRYMSAAGLERKCDVAAYLRKVDRLVERSRDAWGVDPFAAGTG